MLLSFLTRPTPRRNSWSQATDLEQHKQDVAKVLTETFRQKIKVPFTNSPSSASRIVNTSPSSLTRDHIRTPTPHININIDDFDEITNRHDSPSLKLGKEFSHFFSAASEAAASLAAGDMSRPLSRGSRPTSVEGRSRRSSKSSRPGSSSKESSARNSFD